MLFHGATLEALGAATNHTMSITTEMQETSNKDTGKWGTSQPNKYSWSMTSENMFIKVDYDKLVAAMIAGTKMHVLFEIAANANSDTGKPAEGWIPAEGGWEGDCYINQIDANASYDSNASYTVSFTGTGPLAKRGA